MPADRLLPNAEAEEFIAIVDEFASRTMDPIVNEYEREERYPEGLFAQLGETGLLSLPFPEEVGGAGQPYEAYLQILEQIAQHWSSVATAVSVHTMASFAVLKHGTPAQIERFLPAMLEGRLVGGYSLSEPHAGSDVSALQCRAERVEGGYRITGEKSWITHGGKADVYILFARTGEGPKGVSAFIAPGQTEGLTFSPSLDKMGLSAVPTASAYWDGAFLEEDRLLGAEGKGLSIALGALDSGRLGIAAVATGLAQSALDVAVTYAKEREAFGKAIAQHQGVGFMLADMAAATDGARALYVDAARRRDLGTPFTRQASVAKLAATDAAMKVTTDAVQVLGGAGYTRDYPVERYMREAKVMQIFEGTNQIQRLVISRQLVG
ncbi:acyl-CoA dehydrogenase [Microbacterium testaceum]|uniref:Acyl-CoA dehydrogenase n=1 Tax=Microbacterium testaceum TaxID=2033 RepID=A0A147ESY9_MICTE|nr:acyl-CoA dehydrogenase family protein [Microbacterium testaceum]KTR87861.1 acyl-CoA dehydrogenase [Microbacterium testaceum]